MDMWTGTRTPVCLHRTVLAYRKAGPEASRASKFRSLVKLRGRVHYCRWSHARAHVLRDSHMIGGNPRTDEPYGWASYSPQTRQGVQACLDLCELCATS